MKITLATRYRVRSGGDVKEFGPGDKVDVSKDLLEKYPNMAEQEKAAPPPTPPTPPTLEEQLGKLKVDDLKALAEEQSIDLGDASKKDDIIAAIVAAGEVELDGHPGPPTK